MYLKKPLQPSQVMALKWKPVALSPHTPQILGMFLSNSSGGRVDVLTTVVSITKQKGDNEEKRSMLDTDLANKSEYKTRKQQTFLTSDLLHFF